MRTLIFFLIILTTFKTKADAQYIEFSTYFAIEDATGRKDTLWYEANKNGSLEVVDTQLGESEVKQPIDSSLFFIIGSPTYSDKKFFLSKIIINNADTYNAIGFIIIFINAKFPVKIRMDRSFIDKSNEFDYRYTNYFMTYCQNPFLMDYPLMWYDAEGFECLQEEVVNIQDPRIKKAEYSCNDHYVYQIDVMGKGVQTFYGVEIATIILDDYCYSHLGTNPKVDKDPIIIAPNPAGEILKVKLNNGNMTQYDIYDMSGRKIMNGTSEYGNTIDITRLDPGIYIISMFDNHRNVYRQKFVKR